VDYMHVNLAAHGPFYSACQVRHMKFYPAPACLDAVSFVVVTAAVLPGPEEAFPPMEQKSTAVGRNF
jgi:hypothetical protein